MKSLQLLWILCILGFGAELASGQGMSDTTTILLDTSRIKKAQLPDSLKADTMGLKSPAPRIQPWKFAAMPGYHVAADDSTLRWQFWPDWLTFTNTKSGVVSYRRGRVGYNQAMLVQSHESRHQTLYWESHRLNDPVTGTVYWSEIPHHKLNRLAVDPAGGSYQTNFNINQYYVNKPLSRFNYDEGKFDYRSLEFMVTRNFSRKTNAEISYWLRRDGGAYKRDVSRGRQIYAKAYHHIDSDRFLKAAFLHNSFTLEESFGYQISSMSNFNFDRFNTLPNEPSAVNDWGASYLNLGYFSRNRTKGPDRYRVKLFLNTRKKRLSYSQDTLRYKIRSVRTKLQAWNRWEYANIYGEIGISRFADAAKAHQSLSINSWNTVKAKTSIELNPVKDVNLMLAPHLNWRNDGYMTYELSTKMAWDVGERLLLKVDASRGRYMPTPQNLYWQSDEYKGNRALDSERISTVGGEMRLRVSSFQWGIRGRIKQIDDGIFLEPRRDSSFANTDQYYSTMAETYMKWEPPYFEFSGSATWHRYNSKTDDPLLRTLSSRSSRILFKGRAFVKGYVFDRAAYVKAGLFGLYAPSSYRSSHYYASLDIWQSANYSQPVPSYHRLDLNLSARVRSIMVHVRWENITNQLTQRGYFETARYPMPGRRFMLGIRVIFNN